MTTYYDYKPGIAIPVSVTATLIGGHKFQSLDQWLILWDYDGETDKYLATFGTQDPKDAARIAPSSGPFRVQLEAGQMRIKPGLTVRRDNNRNAKAYKALHEPSNSVEIMQASYKRQMRYRQPADLLEIQDELHGLDIQAKRVMEKRDARIAQALREGESATDMSMALKISRPALYKAARRGGWTPDTDQEATMEITITWENGSTNQYKVTPEHMRDIEKFVERIILNDFSESFGSVRFTNPAYGTPGTLAHGAAYFHGQGGGFVGFRVTNVN